MTVTNSPPTPKTPLISLTKKGSAGVVAPQSQAAPKVDAAALIMARNSFYQHNYKIILYIVLGQLAAIATLGVVLYKLLEFTAAHDYFFPIRENNELIQEMPLYEPVYSDEQIREWAKEAVTTTMTFGYYDHLLRLQSSRSYFTTPGWADFTKALDEAQMLSKISAIGVENRSNQPRVVTANLRPGTRIEIISQGINGYRYEWNMHMVIDLSFFGAAEEFRQSWNVDLKVWRVRAMSSRFGVGIQQLIAENSVE